MDPERFYDVLRTKLSKSYLLLSNGISKPAYDSRVLLDTTVFFVFYKIDVEK